ncbi:MAG: retropepsin-like aspartic protease [Nitrospirota bacterium]|nr:retropepsin-like aspartic protease [Nitrospirota bacterium]
METNSNSGLIIRVALVFGIMVAAIGYGINYLQSQGLPQDQLAQAKNQLEPSGILDNLFQSKPPSSTDPSSGDDIIIPLTRKGRSLYVQVELNDYREATLLVDTGASEVALTPDVAFELGLIDGDTPEAMYMTANGQVSSYVTTIESIRLGDAVQYDVPTSISKNNALTGFGDGLLGMSFFEHYIVFVDSAKEELHLRLRDS